MPVYATAAPFAERRRHPKALVLIVAGHAALIAAVMSTKMDLPTKFKDTITRIELIDPPKPPPPEPKVEPKQQPAPRDSVVDRMPTIVPIPMPDPVPLDTLPFPLPIPNPGDAIGPGLDPAPDPRPVADPVRVGPRLATPQSRLKPPYPLEKLRLEEEAALRLKLSIDARGRVVAVDPVGRADRAFLEAARKHLLAHWRYKPATEDGRAVASSTVITLRFELED